MFVCVDYYIRKCHDQEFYSPAHKEFSEYSALFKKLNRRKGAWYYDDYNKGFIQRFLKWFDMVDRFIGRVSGFMAADHYFAHSEYLSCIDEMEFEKVSSYFLTSDLELVECGSGGAAYSIWKKYKLNDVGGLDFVEGYFTDYEEFDESGAPVADSDIVWYKILDGYNYSSTENSEFYCDIDGFDKTIDEYVFEGDELVPFGHAEHRYEVIIEDAKFDEAKAACEAMGGHLVAIETEEEAAVVQKIMSYYYADEKLLFTGAEDGVWPNGEKVGKFLFPEGKIIREGYLGTQISGEDGSFHLVSMSSDPMGEEYYYSGFIGYICEFEPS